MLVLEETRKPTDLLKQQLVPMRAISLSSHSQTIFKSIKKKHSYERLRFLKRKGVAKGKYILNITSPVKLYRGTSTQKRTLTEPSSRL